LILIQHNFRENFCFKELNAQQTRIYQGKRTGKRHKSIMGGA